MKSKLNVCMSRRIHKSYKGPNGQLEYGLSLSKEVLGPTFYVKKETLYVGRNPLMKIQLLSLHPV